MKTKYAIAAMTTALAIIVVAQLAAPGNAGGGYLEVSLLLTLLLVVMSASRFVKGRRGAPGGAPVHDEFETQVLARAGARAHHAMLGVLALVFAWLVLAAFLGAALPGSPGDWATVGLSLLGIGIALPTLFAEVASPTTPAEPDEDASA